MKSSSAGRSNPPLSGAAGLYPLRDQIADGVAVIFIVLVAWLAYTVAGDSIEPSPVVELTDGR